MTAGEKQMHLHIAPGDVGRYCIVPGDPGRSEKIARYLEAPRLIASNREYVTYTGTLEGEQVSVCSTGIGGPSTAIAVEELVACGVDTLIRVGTCGGISTEVKGGDLVIATGSVRQEGTTLEYMPVEYPAVPHLDVTMALLAAAQSRDLCVHTGVVQSKDSFYGQHAPDRMPTAPRLLYQWDAWKKAGVLASEMESSTLFVVGAVLGVRTGALFHVLWNQERAAAGLDNPVSHDPEPAIAAAIEGLRLLILQDRAKSPPAVR